MTQSVDYTPLAATVTAADVAAYRATHPEVRAADGWIPRVVVGAIGAVFASVGVLFLGLDAESTGRGLVPPAMLLTQAAVPLVFVVVGIAAVGRAVFARDHGGWKRLVALDRFAAANGLRFSPRDPSPGYPGAIFQIGDRRVVREHLLTTNPRFIDLGSYEYQTGSGDDRTTHRWTFIAVRLDRRVPNMVLDAKGNDGILGSNLPIAFDRRQVLRLEGDFDRSFTLYCPAEYETDALRIFTPDLMAVLIDEAGPFDVELVDDWMFAYRNGGVDLTEVPQLARLFRIVDTIGAKAVRQTERYRDDRAPEPQLVAPAGRRLRRRVSRTTIIVGALLVAWAVLFFLVPRLLG